MEVEGAMSLHYIHYYFHPHVFEVTASPRISDFGHQMSKNPNFNLQASVLEPIQIVKVGKSGADTKSSAILTPTTFCRLNRKMRLPQKNIKSAVCGLPRRPKSAFQALYFGPCLRSAESSQPSKKSMTYEDKKITRDDEVVVGYWNCLVEDKQLIPQKLNNAKPSSPIGRELYEQEHRFCGSR